MPHELVMPYVTTTSRGGPHDDDAYAAGWQCGRIDTLLHNVASARGTFTVHVPPAVAPQLDLIAMRHQYTATIVSTDTSGEYVEVRFEPAGHDTSPPDRDVTR